MRGQPTGAFHAILLLCRMWYARLGRCTGERTAGIRLGVDGMSARPRIVEVRENALKHNDEIARGLRQRFGKVGVFVVSLVSSPGSGKTAFLEKTLTLLKRDYRPAALVGDLATDNDAARLARTQAPVKQITTGTLCHLEAAMVEGAIQEWKLA